MATNINIKALTSELSDLRTEIKTSLSTLKKLKLREKNIKEEISKFLKDNNLPGVKAQGIAIINEKKEVSVRKKKSETQKGILDVLRHYMPDIRAQQICSEIQNVNKEKIEKQELKIISIK
jgi:hypothetical protein